MSKPTRASAKPFRISTTTTYPVCSRNPISRPCSWNTSTPGKLPIPNYNSPKLNASPPVYSCPRLRLNLPLVTATTSSSCTSSPHRMHAGLSFPTFKRNTISLSSANGSSSHWRCTSLNFAPRLLHIQTPSLTLILTVNHGLTRSISLSVARTASTSITSKVYVPSKRRQRSGVIKTVSTSDAPSNSPLSSSSGVDLCVTSLSRNSKSPRQTRARQQADQRGEEVSVSLPILLKELQLLSRVRKGVCILHTVVHV